MLRVLNTFKSSVNILIETLIGLSYSLEVREKTQTGSKMPAYSNRETETGHVGGYGTKSVSGTGRDSSLLARQAQFTKNFSQVVKTLSFTGDFTSGHGVYLSGCLSYQETGYCLSKIERFKGRIISASPLSPVFTTTDELIEFLKMQFAIPLMNSENELTEVGSKIWYAFESESEPNDYLVLLAQMANIDFSIWWDWTH